MSPGALPQLQSAELYKIAAGMALMLFLSMGMLHLARRERGVHFRQRDGAKVRFEERWTSGRAHLPWVVDHRVYNQLWVTVTDDELWIRPHFPFNIVAGHLQLEHRIPRNAIVRIDQQWDRVRLDFVGMGAKELAVTLYLRDVIAFCEALNVGARDA